MKSAQTILVLESPESGTLESTLRGQGYEVITGLSDSALLGAGFDFAVADFSVLNSQTSPGSVRQSKVPLVVVASSETASAALDWARQNGCGFVLGACESVALNIAAKSSETAAGTATVASGEIETLADCERRHILAVLDRCHGNRTHAAAKLAISVRTLRNKLKEYRETASVETNIAVND